MKDCGKIIKIDEKNITIEISPQAECQKCGACHGAKKRQLAIPVKPKYKDLAIGDNVDLIIEDSIMLKVYMLMYGLPLVIFVAGIVLTYFITEHPLISFAAALILTAITYLFLGKYTRTNEAFLPKIRRR